MVPPLVFDISSIDLNHVMYDAQAIERINPHRGAMRLIDGIIHHDPATRRVIAYKDVRDDEFWVPGHIPGRPLYPGVLMVESAAQVASFATLMDFTDQKFMGFAGVDEVKFRGQVVPGDRLILLGEPTDFRRRRVVCTAQGLVNGTLVFEAKIIGMPM